MNKALKPLISINSRKNFKVYISKTLDLLKNFTDQRSIAQGTSLHGHLIKMGLASDKYMAVKLLIMYLNIGKSSEIDQMLKQFNGFNLVVHNCLISANTDWGNIKEACRLFDEMPERNEVSWTALISGLLKYGRVDDAMWYFQRNPFQSLFAWTATISGLVQNGLGFKAMKLFSRMIQCRIMPNDITFTSVLKACGELGDFELGMSVLALINKVGFEDYISVSNALITFCLRVGEVDLARKVFDWMGKRDVVSWTAILDMYVEIGDLKEARRIFDEMPERNEVSWSAMIARCSQSGNAEEAVNLFQRMFREGYKPNTSCISCVISALAGLEALQVGRNIHGHAVKIGFARDVFVGSSLIDLYCKCGETENGRAVFDSILEKNVVCWNAIVAGYGINGQLGEAKEVFDQIPYKNNVSWNSLMSGYMESERFDEVLEVFNEMILTGELPNKSSFSSVLCACASLASLDKGKNLHGKIVKLGFQYDVFMGTALMDMYAKSGDIESARLVFERMPKRNEICCTAMIQGLAENGFAEEALAFFEEIKQSSMVPLNELIFLAVLFACSHCGLVDKGLHYFNSMEKVYGVHPNHRHYTCVVDILSRSGRLSEAEKFIEGMPCEPEVNAWAALLSGCKTYKEEIMAERIAKKITELSENKPGGYVLLSNIYASAGRWRDVSKMRAQMNEKGLKKTGGCSWIEVKDRIHLFYSQDGSNNRYLKISEILDLLTSEMLIQSLE